MDDKTTELLDRVKALEEKLEGKTDGLLTRIVQSKFSVAYVVAFWLSGYVAGFFLGDVIHLFVK